MNKLQAKMPLALTYIGAIFFTFLSIFTLYRLETTGERLMLILTLIAYVLWMRWESHVSKNELEKEYSSYDGGTMEFAAFAKMTTLTISFLFTDQIHFPLSIFGMLMMLSGIGIRVKAILKLGNCYSHRIRPVGERLVVDGPYGVIRHPAYLGTYLAHIGFVMVFCSIYSLLSCVFLWGAAVLIRVFKEEDLLQKDPSYREYSKSVSARIFPGVF
ncbi:MAG: isoprenylcysteine carboxylmethyltransferase family protein [Oligoflexales bacterium]|nr:isoprenylcysteine carboxylmethyltransferase family protein [Oligoflexales bacterium]